MKPYGGPGFQQVIASQSFYWEGQWWADQGFLVVTADGPGHHPAAARHGTARSSRI